MEELALYIEQVEECLALCRRLEQMLEEDIEQLPAALRGQAAEKYQKTTEEAKSKAAQVRRQLQTLISV